MDRSYYSHRRMGRFHFCSVYAFQGLCLSTHFALRILKAFKIGLILAGQREESYFRLRFILPHPSGIFCLAPVNETFVSTLGSKDCPKTV